MSYSQAQRAANGEARNACINLTDCVEYGAKCRRVSRQRFTCLAWTETYDAILCTWVEKVGVGPGGYIRTRFVGRSLECV